MITWLVNLNWLVEKRAAGWISNRAVCPGVLLSVWRWWSAAGVAGGGADAGGDADAGGNAAHGDAAPDHASDETEYGMAHELGVLGLGDPLDGLREATMGVDEQVLHVVLHAAHALLRRAGAPDETLDEDREQAWGIQAQALDDIGVSLEERVHAVVVAVAVCAEGEQVHDDGIGGLHAAGLDGPQHRGDGLRADLDIQHPQGTLAARGTSDCLVQLLAGVLADRLPDDGGALADHVHRGSRQQAEATGNLGRVVRNDGATHLNAWNRVWAE